MASPFSSVPQFSATKRDKLKTVLQTTACIPPMITSKSLRLAHQLNRLGTRTTLQSHSCPGTQSKKPSTCQRRKFKALETPGSLWSTHCCQCPFRADKETSRFPQVFPWMSSIHRRAHVLQLSLCVCVLLLKSYRKAAKLGKWAKTHLHHRSSSTGLPLQA